MKVCLNNEKRQTMYSGLLKLLVTGRNVLTLLKHRDKEYRTMFIRKAVILKTINLEYC